jgi:hypothetical protein
MYGEARGIVLMFNQFLRVLMATFLVICGSGCQQNTTARTPLSTAYSQGVAEGAADAKSMLAAGRFVLLGFGTPPDWKLKIYESEFGRYGIEWEAYGHSLDDNMEGYVEAFNAAMEKAISQKYGPDVLADVKERVRKRLAEGGDSSKK